MTLIHIRLIAFGLLCYIIYIQHWSLLPYWSAMVVSMEILNRHKTYLAQRFYTLFNLLFVGYLIFVVVDRSRNFRLRYRWEWCINSAMHILFALIVCFKISQYLTVFNIKTKHRNFYIVLIFNILGVLNEFLQNVMCKREIFILIPDARKDLVMNMVGTVAFLLMDYVVLKRSTPSVFWAVLLLW
jgi:hypothetical protein